MSVDRRTRIDAEVPEIDPAGFFERELPERIDAQRPDLEPGADHLGLGALTFEIEGALWSMFVENGRIEVRPGAIAGAAHVRLTREDLGELIHDQCTPMRFYVSGTLDMPSGVLTDFLDWWLVLRGALDGRPVHVPGGVAFRCVDGGPLDLDRVFSPEDDRAAKAHFLEEAGFLRIRGLFESGWMETISREMDAAAPTYEEGDGRSWWAGTADGKRRLVRMQGFDGHSAAATALLEDPRFLALGELTGDGHAHTGHPGNRVEALIKPLDVVSGISDIPWHKDCSLGRHSYDCCSLTVGISVTGADHASGQLRAVAGSHRALLRPAIVGPPTHGLPEVDLPTGTGDVTVHLSCTLHMAQPPVERERRVLYTGFRLPMGEAARKGREKLLAARESAPVTVSQPPGGRHT